MECLVILLTCEKRLHSLYLKIHVDGICQTIGKPGQGNRYLFLCIHGRTHGSKKMGIFRYNGMLIIQLQSADKRLLQF